MRRPKRPQAALALVRDGDLIELDVAKRKLHLREREEARGAAEELEETEAAMQRGVKLYVEHVNQASEAPTSISSSARADPTCQGITTEVPHYRLRFSECRSRGASFGTRAWMPLPPSAARRTT
jgi:hypothetical protein